MRKLLLLTALVFGFAVMSNAQATVEGNAQNVAATCSDDDGDPGTIDSGVRTGDGMSFYYTSAPEGEVWIGDSAPAAPQIQFDGMIAWNTLLNPLTGTPFMNGPGTLHAVCRDVAGNAATSPTVDVVVDNQDNTPPSVQMTFPVP